MKKKYLIAFSLFMVVLGTFSQGTIKIYPYKMEVTNHPDHFRHYVKAPSDSLFGNKVHFISLRNLDGSDFRNRIDQWVNKFKLGDIMWVSYPLIYQKNLKEVVAEIKKRNLYLFDLWGYIPGSGPGGYWQQFSIPAGVTDYFQQELGERWLGMDNGEQDGRYVGSFAPRMYPLGAGRQEQYFNFQRHFEELGNQMGNKLATLVSLNFGHYFLKEGLYTMIGAETAQGLPNSQIYYSFIRGAGKQYGVHWFGNASVWNRWGWKVYEKKAIKYDDNDYDAGNPLKGTSLSLLKRLIYTHLFYNCSAVGFEGSMELDDKTLSPIGKIQQQAVKWNDKYGNMGVMYTPVAFMTDFLSGWSFPRHLYSGNAYRVWGNLPYEKSDYMTDNFLNLIYPGYQDSSFYHDERGFISPTPYGDIADCILSDAPLWLLRQYPILVIADEIKPSLELKDKLDDYIKNGGHLVITAASLKNVQGGLAGINVTPECRKMNSSVEYNGRNIQESQPFLLCGLQIPQEAKILQQCEGMPAVVRSNYGSGQVTVIASPYCLTEEAQCSLPVKIKEDQPLGKPYPILNHVKTLMHDIFSQVKVFDVSSTLSTVTCVKNKNEYNVLVINNEWNPQNFHIKSNVGDIASITEMNINDDEMKALGYMPKTVETNPGSNKVNIIAGGGVRAFHIKLKHPAVAMMDKVYEVPNRTDLTLTLRNTRNIKEEILLRPTFFEHFNRVTIDWSYMENRDKDVMKEESGWIKRQKLGITIDLTSGINLYPDLRIVANDSIYYPKSMDRIKKIMDKMVMLGADQLIVTSQRTIENNFTMEKFNASLINTLQLLSDYAAERNIKLLLRPSYKRYPDDIASICKLIQNVNRPNFEVVPSISLLLMDYQNFASNYAALKTVGVKTLFLAAPQFDIHNQLFDANLPIFKYADKEKLRKILTAYSDANYILDGLYSSQDDEYLDIKELISLKK